MKQAQERHLKRKLRTSSLSTMLSISLVLLMLGSMGFIFLNTHRLTNYIKENVGFTLILQENIKKVDRLQLQKSLDASPQIKSTEFVSKEDARNKSSSIIASVLSTSTVEPSCMVMTSPGA